MPKGLSSLVCLFMMGSTSTSMAGIRKDEQNLIILSY